MKPILFAQLIIFYISSSHGFWLPSESSSLVIATRIRRSDEYKESPSARLNIYEMDLYTNVTNRYANTLITTKAKNDADVPQEAYFSVVIPDLAFISDFQMAIDQKKYAAFVQDTQQAKDTYEEATITGQSAGLVTVSARDSKRFTVQINVEPQSNVIFYLTYEQLLVRDDHKYEIILNIQPGQLVDKLQAQVDINESVNLAFVGTPDLRSGNEAITKENKNLRPEAEIIWTSRKSATVKFHPSIEKQKKYARTLKMDPDNGFLGQFVVEYDVDRNTPGGEVIVDDSHFVHFFAPPALKPLSKSVVFVLDTSGSMSGAKIQQLKEAMHTILQDLRTEDVFGIVEFSDIIKVWNVDEETVQNKYVYSDVLTGQISVPPPYKSTKPNIVKAINIVDSLEADGATDIYSALIIGLKMVKDNSDYGQPLLIFLTDGQANDGIRDGDEIVSKVKEFNSGNCPIFAIAVGEDADKSLLERISLTNRAFFKHIYADKDVDTQLEDFYSRISSPELTNVTFKYTTQLPDVAGVTSNNLDILFSGKEMVVTGIKGPKFVPPSVDAVSKDGPVSLSPKLKSSAGKLERLWAYKTLQQMLENRTATGNESFAAEALKIAMKYSFVSEVSSMVVVTPDATRAVGLQDAYEPSPELPIDPVVSIPEDDVEPETVNEDSGSIDLPYPKPIYEEAYIQPEVSKVEIVRDKMPWLYSIMHSNGSILLSSGVYELGLDEPFMEGDECDNTIMNSTISTCRLLDGCSPVYDIITSVQQYEMHFCTVRGFAGVCCPLWDLVV